MKKNNQETSLINKENQQPNVVGGEDSCRTPTSQRDRIPAAVICPPAPLRPKRTVLGKRKVSQIQFFENSNGRKEIEVFFASFSELPRVAPSALKKRLFVSQ